MTPAQRLPDVRPATCVSCFNRGSRGYPKRPIQRHQRNANGCAGGSESRQFAFVVTCCGFQHRHGSFGHEQSGDAEGHLEDLENLSGIVANAGSALFTLQTVNMENISVNVDSNTEFDGFDGCMTPSVTCLQNGQSVDVDLCLSPAAPLWPRKSTCTTMPRRLPMTNSTE